MNIYPLTTTQLLDAVQQLIIPYIRSADEDAATKHTGHGLAIPGGGPRTALVEHHPPKKLESLLALQIPDLEGGKKGLLDVVKQVLRYSVNTWDQGFMDKLYASTNAVSFIDDVGEGERLIRWCRLVLCRNCCSRC
jgi:glutamate decarboxylase